MDIYLTKSRNPMDIYLTKSITSIVKNLTNPRGRDNTCVVILGFEEIGLTMD